MQPYRKTGGNLEVFLHWKIGPYSSPVATGLSPYEIQSLQLLIPPRPLILERFQNKKMGFRSARRECLEGHASAHVKRPPLATLGRTCGAGSPWRTGLERQSGLSRGKSSTCGRSSRTERQQKAK